MKRKRWLSGIGAVVALACGYEALDAFDVVPGPLTLQPSNTPRAVTLNGVKYTPLGVAVTSSLPKPADGKAPSSAAVQKALDTALTNPWFGTTTAVTVLDGDTGTVLGQKNSSQKTEPASVTKLTSAYAIAHSKLDLHSRLKTRAMLTGGRLQLVAGGDMVLSAGAGNESQIAGRAGLADLAAQAAAQLKSRGQTSITVDSNTSYAPGPLTAKGWGDGPLDGGFTARISMLGLVSERADDHTPSAKDPVKDTTNAFVAALKKNGIDAKYGTNVTTAPSGQQVGEVQSAPVIELLGYALRESDNSMIESLARQAAALDGVHGESVTVGKWVVAQLKSQGINVDGMSLQDVCGLSPGTTLPVRILGDLLARGSTGRDPAYQQIMSRLAVSGWNGTLNDRFDDAGPQGHVHTKLADGIVEAKTGSLGNVASLAGQLPTRSGRRLVFAITSNNGFSQGPEGVRDAIDELVTDLTQLP